MRKVDESSLVPDESLTIDEGAVLLSSMSLSFTVMKKGTVMVAVYRMEECGECVLKIRKRKHNRNDGILIK